jgi:hypothetical protein
MRNTSLVKSKIFWSAAIAAVLFLACFLPIQTASASTGDVVGVDGRIIPASMTGDTSAWVEIAQFSGYALIIRQDPISNAHMAYRNDYALDNMYAFSTVRKEINNWYNSELSSTARLRNFAVTNNVMSNLGSYGAAYIDGISKPLGVAAPKGDDVAFALSFCEAAYFCSTQYYCQANSTAIEASPNLAFNNYHKLRPAFAGRSQSGNSSQAYWLRSPGKSSRYAGAVDFQIGAPRDYEIPFTDAEACGRVNMHTVIGSFCHYRPAMWVEMELFDEKMATITYYSNNGTGSVNAVSVPVNVYYTIQDNGYQPRNLALFAFDSWNTRVDGSGVRYVNGQSVFMNTSLTLYAQWKQAPKLAVTYKPNVGIGNTNVVPISPNTYYTVQDQGYYWNEHTFNGWNTRADGLGVPYSNNQVIYITNSIVLYAQWKR